MKAKAPVAENLADASMVQRRTEATHVHIAYLFCGSALPCHILLISMSTVYTGESGMHVDHIPSVVLIYSSMRLLWHHRSLPPRPSTCCTNLHQVQSYILDSVYDAPSPRITCSPWTVITEFSFACHHFIAALVRKAPAGAAPQGSCPVGTSAPATGCFPQRRRHLSPLATPSGALAP
jgi:hypothetical protein